MLFGSFSAVAKACWDAAKTIARGVNRIARIFDDRINFDFIMIF
jgi:hypothetical protein